MTATILSFVMWFVFSGLIFVLLKRENKLDGESMFGLSFIYGLFFALLFMVACFSIGVVKP